MSLARRTAEITAALIGIVTTVVGVTTTVGAILNPIDTASAHASPPATTVSSQMLETFKSSCYDLMPDLAAVEQYAANGGWTPVEGMALKTLAPESGSKSLKGWKLAASEGQAAMTIAVAVADMEPEMAEAMPEFAGSDVNSCSVISGASADHEQIAEAMRGLVGRAHDSVEDAGSLTSNVWAAVTPDIAVIMSHYRPKTGTGVNVLAMVTMTK